MSLAVYNPKTNEVRTLIRADHGGYRPPDGWELVEPQLLPADWTREALSERERAAQMQQIKDRCREDILERYPEWKQVNMTARAVELLDRKTDDVLTAAELAEIAEIRAAWAWIKDRRRQSDEEEKALLSDLV